MKKFILTIILISLTFCDDDCSSKSESDCTSDSNCEWTSAKCSGDSGTTCSSVTVEATCKTTTYTGSSKACVFTAAVEDACSGTIKACTEITDQTICGYNEGC